VRHEPHLRGALSRGLLDRQGAAVPGHAPRPDLPDRRADGPGGLRLDLRLPDRGHGPPAGGARQARPGPVGRAPGPARPGGGRAMVGDRIMTDVAMAQRAGVPAILVLSGEATAADAAALATPPDLVVADVGELGERLERARARARSVGVCR